METKQSIGTMIALITGVAIAVLSLIFIGTLSGNVYSKTEADVSAIGSRSVVNTSFTFLNNTAVYLGYNDIHSDLLVYNVTTGRLIDKTNYTVDSVSGTITLTRAAVTLNLNDSAATASFTYGNTTISDAIRNGQVAGFEALEDTGGLTPIIVLAVIIAIVLAMVLGISAFNSGKTGGAL